MIVVCNTSPITNLAQVEHLWILHQLYGEVYIPVAVRQELEHGIRINRHPPEFFQAHPWIRTQEASEDELIQGLLSQLGRGEAECIALGVELKADLVVIDERRASRQARQMGLRCTGTLGIIMDAKNQGIIQAVRPVVDALRDRANFWLSEAVYAAFLQLAGET